MSELWYNMLVALMICQGILVIFSSNAITSVLFMVGCYLSTSILFLILGAEFLAMITMMMYVGAMAILFISVMMMLNISLVEVYNSLVIYSPLGFFIVSFFLIEVFYLIGWDFPSSSFLYYGLTSWDRDIFSVWNLQKIGLVLYSNYPLLVWMAGWLLLLAMIGAINLTIDFDRSLMSNKRFNNYLAIKRLSNRIVYWESSSLPNFSHDRNGE